MLQQHVAQIAGLEKERDFYYQKLRDVEMICQEPECESLSHIQKILEILYATEVKRKQIESLMMKRKTFSFLFSRTVLLNLKAKMAMVKSKIIMVRSSVVTAMVQL